MVLLSEPDENRLWLVIAALLGVTVVLLFASFQVPWYTADWTTGDVEAHGSFDFSEGHLELYSDDVLLQEHTQVYGDDSAFGDLMGRVGILVGLGTFAALAMTALLYVHYRGWYSQPLLISLSWIVGVAGIVAGLTIFSLGAGNAGADEVAQQMALAAQYLGIENPGRPQPTFWGTQSYAGGELVSAPGVGWLLAILALLNLAAAVLLLYQFPSGSEQEDDQAVRSFEVVSEREDPRETREPLSATQGPSGRN